MVTILFTDLVGSTARAEGLDPEDVRATLSAYYAQLRAELERHGGTVEKFIGDAVMAIFGAPVAHEDDPERAVRAALAIRDSIGEELELRTAVHTGEALVALGARSVEGEGMVSGDVVNTAARLQSAAPVNGILVGEGTYRATRHAIDYRDAPAVEAKGKAEPVKVWEAVSARSRFGSDVEQKLRTPLVGTRARTEPARRRPRARAHGAVGAARDSRRRPGDREEPPGRGAVPDHGSRPRPDLLAPGPLPPLRRARELLGARRDRESARRDPRVGRRSDSRGEARGDGRGSRGRREGAGVARAPHAPPRRARGRRAHRTGRGVRCLAAPARGGSGATAADPRVRGSPLGRRRAPRLRRPPRRLGDDRSAPDRRDRPSRAPRPQTRLGRRQAQRVHTLDRRAERRRDCRPSPAPPRPRRARRRRAAGGAAARRGKPALRRGVRAHARRARRRRPAAAGDRAGPHRGTDRRAGVRRRRRSSRTRRSWARSSGPARCRKRTRPPSMRSSERSSSAATGAPRSPARRSTPSCTRSSATSRTGRSRAPSGPRSTVARGVDCLARRRPRRRPRGDARPSLP